MITLLAFCSGVAVTVAALVIPHARTPHTSVDEFSEFQNALRTLPVHSGKTQSRVR